MSLLDIDVKTEYRSKLNDIVNEFYIPLLEESVLYKRAVGFFSSSALIEISKGISGLIKNGGKIQLIVSPKLEEDDIIAIEKGFELREKIIENSIERSFTAPKDIFEKKRLNLIANLVANGQLDIKVAFMEEENSISMFHEKMGLIYDCENNIVAFSGSMNETKNAFLGNYESIDVYSSWTHDINRVKSKETAFNALWENYEPHIKTIDFPKIAKERLYKYKTDNTIDTNIDVEEFNKNDEEIKKVDDIVNFSHNKPQIPTNVQIREYQIEAIDEWEKANFKGIYDMATGTGKTFTGLASIVKLYEKTNGNLAVFIVAPYQHLVEQWVDDIEFFGMKPVVGYSASKQKNWKTLLEDDVLDYKLKVKGKEFFVFISTNATFASEFVQKQINKLKGNMLLVVDEAHNFGATYLQKTLNEKFNYRLALSATIHRHNDELGTNILKNYFGEKCIEYTLDKAIKEGKLTKYKYFPIVTTLNESELREYESLSQKISKCVIKDKNGKMKLNEIGKKLALKRARLVASTEDKVLKLEEHIKPYVNEKHILVYCGAAKMLAENQEYTRNDEEDIRQIDKVTDLLGNELNMKVAQFTSNEGIVERERLKKEFAEGDNLQTLIAIKCLDEGVNIPEIKLAFILASTTNPKEYIQRRGRVLRLSKGKDFATIYDFITLPRQLDEANSLSEYEINKYSSLVKNELCRIQEFSRLALNEVTGQSLYDDIIEAFMIDSSTITFGEDNIYE